MLEYFKRRIAAFKYSFDGVKDLVRNHPHAHIHAFASFVVIALGWNLEVSRNDWVVLTICIGIVWTAEAFNTSIEYLTDLVSPNYHPLAGKVKDMASAAVLLAAIASAIAGSLIFWPYLQAFL